MEKVNLSNIIQILSIQNASGGTSIIALCSDSTMWEKMITYVGRRQELTATKEDQCWKLINNPEKA